MKIFKYIAVFMVFVLVTGCEDYFGDNANVDPDNPTTATANVLLPQVQARLAYTWGGDLTRYFGINTQHVDGIGRQFAVLGQYGIQPNDVDNVWSNLYSGGMSSNRQMIAAAEAGGFNHYVALGNVMEAWALMMATDAWGDIPYSDAFELVDSEGNIKQPTLDSQESIYNSIFTLLDDARGLLGQGNGGNPPGGDDLFYGGDVDAWVACCNVLEARAQLHLSKRNGDAYSRVLAALNKGGFADASGEFAFKFGSNANENAPWYQYIEQRDDCEVGAYYTGLLASLNDPRAPVYGFEHAVPGHPVFTPDQNLQILSYTEQEFMRAEALMGTGDSAGAYDAYLAAIASSFSDAGVDGYDDYVGQPTVGVGAGNISMEDIMTQKYLALYTSPELFNDWRRTGMPALTPISGTQIPRRLPYAELEQFSNPNIPSPATISIYDRVWWDQ
ncbi:MAG: SusD/RagB family nutrient-binding outer membrane lipoprotein [Bacteroidia bacterium]|nr:SusD/RagB family nutrient-binding outer membrane lipoprotein [Bacteroidia bacterium]